MTRTGAAAAAWARSEIEHRTEDWYRNCLRFVRSAFDVPVIVPDAGKSWDQSLLKHPVAHGAEVPEFVPVFFELPSVADHVAFSIGGGRCISTDVRRHGWPDVVGIDDLARAWGADLLGWTEDMNGVRIWSPPTPAPEPKPPTRVETARGDVEAALRVLRKAEKAGHRGQRVVEFRHALRDALDAAPDR